MTLPSGTIIFLDIDGVLCTQSPWKPEVMAADGYSEFNTACVENLNKLIELTGASIVLTSSRRMNKTTSEFAAIMQRRGVRGTLIGKIDDALQPNGATRAAEIQGWISRNGEPTSYVILDDDSLLADLDPRFRYHWVRTTYHRGFDTAALAEALNILQRN